MLQAILFDLDNTLVNFWAFKQASAKEASRAMVEAGLPMTPERCYNLIFSIYKSHGVEYQQTFTELLKPFEFEKPVMLRIRDAGISAYLRSKSQVLKPYDGVPEMLAALQPKYKLGVLTDAPRTQAHQRLAFTGLQEYFSAVGTFHDTNAMKPDAAPFLHICEKLKVEPKHVLMVGDNPARDIKGAHLLGMKTCLAKYDQWYENEGPTPDFIIHQPLELLDLVHKL